MTFTIATMSRGDAPRLEEWVDYHTWLGFSDFHIVLDNPCDDSEDILRSMTTSAKITVNVRPAIDEYYDGMTPAARFERVKAWRIRNAESIQDWGLPLSDSQTLRQHLHLTPVLNKYALRKDGWLALIDLDEFIVLPGGKKIEDLTAQATAPRLRFLNFNFSTVGHQPGQRVLPQHTMRWAREDIEAYGQGWEHRVKTMARYDSLLPMVSVHAISPSKFQILDPEVGRLHHYRMSDQGIKELPYRVEDRTLANLPAGAYASAQGV